MTEDAASVLENFMNDGKQSMPYLSFLRVKGRGIHLWRKLLWWWCCVAGGSSVFFSLLFDLPLTVHTPATTTGIKKKLVEA